MGETALLEQQLAVIGIYVTPNGPTNVKVKLGKVLLLFSNWICKRVIIRSRNRQVINIPASTGSTGT